MTTETSVRSVDMNRDKAVPAKDIISEIYDGRLDVAVVRAAFDPEMAQRLAEAADVATAGDTWSRPNAVVPSEDIYILGTDTPATPTCKAPRGASLAAYLESAGKHAASAGALTGSTFDAELEIASLLREMAGGKPASVALSGEGQRYVPYTLRLLKEGKQISVHHDYHYPLALYSDLSQRLDTTTLVSFFLTLQRPLEGGTLIVYGLDSDDPEQPVFPNGRWDLQAIENKYEAARFELNPGDVVFLAAGRRFHRVETIVGTRPRITLGGFLAFDKAREHVLFWS